MSRNDVLELIRTGKTTLSPSQAGISLPILERIYQKMKAGLKFDSIQVAGNSIIVNGHHRYLASLLAGVELEMVECPLTSAKKITLWEAVELVDADWDTPDRIHRLNQRDAVYNEMPLERLLELIG